MDVKERLQNLIVNLRNRCLFKGVGGIKELSVAFRRMDSDYNRRICYQEWMEGLEICGLDVTEEETCMLFVAFDTDKNGEIDFLEFVAKLRPPMNSVRSAVVNEAFDMLDHDHNGVLEIDDLKIVYSTNARKHPKYMSGEWTEEQVLRNFLDSIDTPGNPDGKVTREEFMNYYAGVSATVDDDSYFDLMMRACYGLPNKGETK